MVINVRLMVINVKNKIYDNSCSKTTSVRNLLVILTVSVDNMV